MCVCKGILCALVLFFFLWVHFYILPLFNLCYVSLLPFLFDVIMFFAKGRPVIWMIAFYCLFLSQQDNFHPLEAASDCS